MDIFRKANRFTIIFHVSNAAFSSIFIIFFITGCAYQTPYKNSTSNDFAKIYPGSFYRTIQNNRPGNLYIPAEANAQISLIPAGPYVNHNLPLENKPLAIASDEQNVYLATNSSNNNQSSLLIIQLTGNGKLKVVKQLNIKGVITRLAYNNNHLGYALKKGGIRVLDVSNPISPTPVIYYPTKNPVLDIQYDNEFIYLLLKNNHLQKVNLKEKTHTKSTNAFIRNGLPAGELLHDWKLPVPVNSFAIRNNLAILAGPEGVASVKLSNTNLIVIDLHTTNGKPQEIQINKDLALLADGSGGLVIYRIGPKGTLQWAGSYNKRDAINTASITDSTLSDKGATTVLVSLANGNVMTIDVSNPQLPSSVVTYKPPLPALLSTKSITKTKLSKQPNALIATEKSLQWVIMTGNNKQQISSEGVNQGGSRRGTIRNNILYVADWFSGLHIYDISNPEQIRHLSNFHTPGSSKGVTLKDNYALIGDDDQGLQIIDIKDPGHPRRVSELTPESLSGTGLAYTLKTTGNTLYLADHRGGFHIIDITDIKNPIRLGGYNTPGKSWGIDVVKNTVYVADDSSGLLIFDASNPRNPEMIGSFNPGGQAEDIIVKDNLAYVTFFDKGLFIIDVKKPQDPILIGQLDIPGNARGITLDKNHAYISGWESGLHIVEILNPETPRIVGNFDTNGAAWGANINNDIAYVLDWWGGIKAIDVKQPSNPVYLGQYHAREVLQQLHAHNKYLFTVSGAGGLQVYDIKNPLNPIWSTGIDLNGHSQDVWIEKNRAYVAAGKDGIYILNILDPFNIHRIRHISTPGHAFSVRGWNEFIYVYDSKGGLMVFDEREPEHPKEIASYLVNINDLWIDEHRLWAGTSQGLFWWKHNDISKLHNSRKNNPLKDAYHYKSTESISRVSGSNQLIATAHYDGTVMLWQKTANGLTILSKINTQGLILDLQLDKKSLYILNKHHGLMAYNISDPTLPRLNALYPSTGNHTTFEIAQGAAFLAGESRLASVTLLPLTSASYSDSSKEIELKLPANLPIGQYHLLATTKEGEGELYPNALNVQYSISNNGKSPLENMKHMLTRPLKAPPEP